ncbi:GFA family protein [Phaeobacter porticola]|uniref:Putative glutathione-dependent formaldehyde-activating enzyme, GFA n=1 Tax=Phaeobacter porticola TaxID=1844006 RepID=A0A1L3I6Q3_9RHOB|nr:GFA family protein [Phaeobacter porticola]APG47770.1 putative glutathione-dependent formaldehyde-activating enzyme, GFA [Phaeobacter porticola]
MEDYQGSCLCGAIRITTSGPPLRVGICHCRDCRKHHGALFYAAAIFPAPAVTIDGIPNQYAGRHFCPTCGSSIFAQTGGEIEIHLGSLDSTDGLIPSYESWCLRREAWLPDLPGMIRYERDRHTTEEVDP